MKSIILAALLLVDVSNFSAGYVPTNRGVAFHRNLVDSDHRSGSVSSSGYKTLSLSPLKAQQKKWSPHMSVSASNRASRTPDFLALFNYLAATSLQFGLIVTFLHTFQLMAISKIRKSSLLVLPNFIKSVLPTAIATELPRQIQSGLPSVLVTIFMLLMSLRSRVFSPLDNSRPSASKDDPVFKDRLRPSWTPPPLAFPLIWSTIALLRTISTVMIFKSTGTLLCKPIFALMAHLSIGDTWNTINNVEKRLGTAVLGVAFVWASAGYAAYLYYNQLPLAGKVLFPSCVWLTVASFLVYSIWRMNSIYLTERSSLFPSKEEGPRSSWRMPFFPQKR